MTKLITALMAALFAVTAAAPIAYAAGDEKKAIADEKKADKKKSEGKKGEGKAESTKY